MKKKEKSNSYKPLKSSSYGMLYYTYFNPSSTYNKKYNIQKRQRSKDSYVEIANEKKDLISYEIIQIHKYTQKNKSKTVSQIYPEFNTSNGNSKKIENQYEISNIENLPYSTTLRNHSSIINNEKVNSLFKNKGKIINKRNKNFIGSYKISNKIKQLVKSGMNNNNINQEFSTNKKDENYGNVCLGKISIETYLFKNKNCINNNQINNKDNQNPNIINNDNLLLLDNKQNINEINNCKNFSNINKSVKRKLNYEEEKNEEILNKNQPKNKIHKTLQEMKVYLENIKPPFKGKNPDKNTKNNNYKKMNKINNINTQKKLERAISCPQFIPSKKDSIDIIQNSSLEENINKILKRNDEFIKNKKFFEIKEEKEINKKYIYSYNSKYKEIKLKELLKKIPKHKNNERNKSVIEFKTFKDKNFKVIKDKKNKKSNKFNLSDIMPPNNLKELVNKNEINFLFN